MGNVPASSAAPPPQIVVLSDLGDVSTIPNTHSETWAQLCRRTCEGDYLPRLLPLLVRMYPSKRLTAYRLRYDVGMATIVKPTWSEGGINGEAGVEEAFLDANISLVPDPTRNSDAVEFAPHETILSTVGGEGAKSPVFVRVRFKKLHSGEPPFPVRRELTRVLYCEEHDQYPGYTDCYRIEEWNEENGKLPKTCINAPADNGGTMVAKKASSAGGGGGAKGSIFALTTAMSSEGASPPKESKNARKKRQKRESGEGDADLQGGEKPPSRRMSPRKKENGAQPVAAGKEGAEKSSKADPKKKGSKPSKEDGKKKKVTDTTKSEKAGTKRKAEGDNKKGSKQDGKKSKENKGESASDGEKQPAQKKGRLVRSHPTGERDTHIPSEPAPKLPNGWTLRRFPRNADGGREDVRFYSPIEDFRFLSKVEAVRFIERLEEAQGDEKKAMSLLKQGGKEKKQPAKAKVKTGAGKKSKGDDDGDRNPAKAAAGKGKRKSGDSKAVKKALEELKSGENDGSDPQSDADSDEPKKKKPKSKKKKEGKGGESKVKSKEEEKPAVAKKKKPKKKVDPNEPKRPASAYIMFMKDNRSRIAKENPELDFREIASKVGQVWKELSEDESKPYKEEAAAAMKKWKTAMEEYRQAKV
ncbi:hypothetical protein ACHAXT_001476 [Thalassiosira profunda]